MTNTGLFPISGRLYAMVLWLYPKSLRSEFGDEMREVFCEQMRDASDQRGWRGSLAVWRCVVCETARTLAESYVQTLGVSIVSALVSLLIMCVMLGSLSH
jgi:hypothetical protein